VREPAGPPLVKRGSAPGDDREATHELSRFGYREELARKMGGFSSFALSFSIVSVLTGILGSTSYRDALAAGGPIGVGLGWPLVSLGTLLVALSMGELASAFPTAGALYHWSAWLGGPGWGWLTAMLNLVGQVAMIGAIDYACADTFTQAVGLDAGWKLPLFVALVLAHVVLNVFSVLLSIELVGSSSTRIGGLSSSARATATD